MQTGPTDFAIFLLHFEETTKCIQIWPHFSERVYNPN